MYLVGRPPRSYGGTGGHHWDDGMYHGVREITIASGLCIDSLRVAYDQDGQLVIADKHGGIGGSPNTQIKLEYPDEFLVSASGHYYKAPWIEDEPVVIRSLKFQSNRRTFGPFGVEEGTPFTFTVEDGDQIVGMKGRSGWYIDAIAFHISRAPRIRIMSNYSEGDSMYLIVRPPLNYCLTWGRGREGSSNGNGSVPERSYGGTGGHPWDDGMYHGVREITITSGLCIDSLRVAYDKEGQLVIADKHGGNGGSANTQIKLEYPGEFLVSVSGYYFPVYAGTPVIRSLKFQSNKRTFGPFGVEEGTPFTFTVEDGDQIVGMKGRSGLHIDAIAFHISHAPRQSRLYGRNVRMG